jgi:hypothetical protein
MDDIKIATEEKLDGKEWNGFIRLRIGTSHGILGIKE